jgi:hypothetical protein
MSWLSSFPILTIPLAIGVAADEREIARSLLEQLDDRRFTERKSAFLKLCDPRWNIDSWLDEQSRATDPNRSALAQWIRRLRSMTGSMEERLDMLSDYQLLVDGDLSVVSKYIDNRRIPLLVDLVEILPQSVRENLLRYPTGDNPFDQAISAAWRDGCEEIIPRLLNAILPRNAIRVGINERWREIGMPEGWHVELPLDVPEVEAQLLANQGKIEQALEVAKRFGLAEEYERLLIQHQRWDAWLELDPMRKGTSATGWDDVQRILLLECLGRHEEALVYYEIRKSDKSKGKSIYHPQNALLALFTGDMTTWESLLRDESPNGWIDVLFLHSDLDRLLQNEGLSELSRPSVEKWFDKWARQGQPIAKPIRFQSLFHRLGLKELEETLYGRIHRHLQNGTGPGDASLLEWHNVLVEWSKYGLDERRLDVIAELSAKRESDRARTDWALTQRGLQPAQDDTRTITLDTIFSKNFPHIRYAALPLNDTLRKRFPELEPRERIALIDNLNDGRMPTGWTESDLMSVSRDMIRSAWNDPSVLEPMLVDLADLFATLGFAEQALTVLQGNADSHAANILIAEYASKLGQIDEASRLALQLLDRHRDDVNAHLLATQCLADARRFDLWLKVQQQSLSRLDLWEWIERYFQTARSQQKLEPQPEILFLLEMLQRHVPSTWQELWFGNAYTQYGARIQADWYHRSMAQHPERIADLRQLALQNAFEDIRSRSRSQFPDQGAGGNSAMADIDWSLWSLQYERVFAACFWLAVQDGNLPLADQLIRTAQRISPEQINTLIDVVPLVRSQFGDDTLRSWYEIYAEPMRVHLQRFPDDTLIANNAAWLAAKCGVELDRAHRLATQVTQLRPTDTYLDTLAEVEFALGNTAKAIEISQACRSMKPRDPHHLRQLERFRNAAEVLITPSE